MLHPTEARVRAPARDFQHSSQYCNFTKDVLKTLYKNL